MTTHPSKHSICLLATGDELVNGDILNTDGQLIAQQCVDANIHIAMHMVVPDDVSKIAQAIEHLLQHGDTLIITGGLGPTSDDITRIGLSEYLQQPLEFHQPTWDEIVRRFKIAKLVPSEQNRQQALFPKAATILDNHSGSAAGCKAVKDNKTIYMLPGPPHECLPMFEKFIFPDLKQYANKDLVTLRWRVFGIAESMLAEILEPIAKQHNCKTGYRWHYPYIDFKVMISKSADIDSFSKEIDKAVEPYFIVDSKHTASELLKSYLQSTKQKIVICDCATGGALQAKLFSPETKGTLQFCDSLEKQSDYDAAIVVSGLNEYWQVNSEPGSTELKIEFQSPKGTHQVKATIPFRNQLVKRFAVEYISYQILKYLKR